MRRWKWLVGIEVLEGYGNGNIWGANILGWTGIAGGDWGGVVRNGEIMGGLGRIFVGSTWIYEAFRFTPRFLDASAFFRQRSVAIPVRSSGSSKVSGTASPVWTRVGFLRGLGRLDESDKSPGVSLPSNNVVINYRRVLFCVRWLEGVLMLFRRRLCCCPDVAVCFGNLLPTGLILSPTIFYETGIVRIFVAELLQSKSLQRYGFLMEERRV